MTFNLYLTFGTLYYIALFPNKWTIFVNVLMPRTCGVDSKHQWY